METDRISINAGWLFAKTEEEDAVKPNFDESAFQPVRLPHDWQITNPQTPEAPGGGSQGFFPREEVGVYHYHFTAPEEWKGKLVRVLFDGAQRFSEVYVNGEYAGGRKYGYVPLLCELKNLKYGEDNLLSVRLDNRAAADKNAGGGDRWYSGAGLYRNAWLLVDEATHIRHDGVFVTAKPKLNGPVYSGSDGKPLRAASADVCVTVENEGGLDGFTLEIDVLQGGQSIYTERQNALKTDSFCFTLKDAYLWTTQQPCLYALRARLMRGEACVDEQCVRFGVRSAVFDEEDGFLLNCVKTKLWGVNFHHDGGPLGAAVPIELWRRRLENAKKLGVNAVRCSHNPMAEEFYDLCDELGLLVIDEYCDKWQNNGFYFDLIDDGERLEEIEIMLRRDRNHPSVILWSVGNEIGPQYSEYFFATLEKLCAKVRQLDPTRGVSTALIGFVLPDYNAGTPLGVKLSVMKRYAGIVDVFMGNYMEQYYEKLREAGMRKPIIGSEVHTYYCYSTDSLDTLNMSAESPYAIVKRHDWVCGAFVWAGCDYLGETGLGGAEYSDYFDERPETQMTGGNGRIDLSGKPRCEAYYTRVALEQETGPYIGVYPVYEKKPQFNGWTMSKALRSWSYPGFEGEEAEVEVYARADSVELFVNGKSVGKNFLKKDCRTTFKTTYLSGSIEAVSYDSYGIEIGRDRLESAGKETLLQVRPESASVRKEGLVFIPMQYTDEKGIWKPMEKHTLKVEAEGGEIMGLGNAAAYFEGNYAQESVPTYFGEALTVVRAFGTGPVKVRVSDEKGTVEVIIPLA